MEYSKLILRLREVFLEQENYFFDKHVPEFVRGGKFLGDYFNQIAVEVFDNRPPRFYHTYSPFDIISGKAPHYAAVFQDGERILDTEFDQYVSIRTAAMNVIVLQALGITDLSNKKVLLFGSGKIATEAVKILYSVLSLKTVDVITKSGNLNKIANQVNGVSVQSGSVDNISEYDVIICHTKTDSPVMSENHIQNIKRGAVITSFISSTEHGELPDSIYNESKATIIADWDKTILGAKDLQRAKEAGLFSNIVYLKDLLSSEVVNRDTQYIVYRSTGTPIQNLAVLKELLG